MTCTAFENRFTAELSSGGLFAVWCLRKRAHCVQPGAHPEDQLGYGFQLAGIPSALRPFEVVFEWLTRTAGRPLQLGRPTCARVSCDEGLVLAALAAFQRGDAGSGRILLQCLIPRVPCLHAAPVAAQFAEALMQANLPIDLAVAARGAPAARGHGDPAPGDPTPDDPANGDPATGGPAAGPAGATVH
ncbi:hypothetical protein CKO28_19065 [Rhodovibrio sodomensis]|uniref:Uncharacterized protein n=1 Tax=Rhodovibrio sodomensis TaxID=1088 RepID=A0ABS1DI37_9PROT|nr:hypothetical protein [Rhodovibrio sodomensis]MBK1670140.1 hypothetical protein [Rhodovibrio sodomensis]